MNIVYPAGLEQYMSDVEAIVLELNPELNQALIESEGMIEEVIYPYVVSAYYNDTDAFDVAQNIVLKHADELEDISEGFPDGITVQTINSPEELIAALDDAFGEEEGEDPLDIARDLLGGSETLN